MTAIKNGTLLVKDSNGNTARVATLSQTDITTLNTALTDIDANKRKISSISANYVTTNTAQTISKNKVFANQEFPFIVKDARFDNSVAPTKQLFNSIVLKDKNDKNTGMVQFEHGTSGYHSVRISAIAQNADGNNIYAPLTVGIKSDGTTSTSAPSPASNSNDSSIATTAWVNDKVNPIKNNYVTTNTQQDITGLKVFNRRGNGIICKEETMDVNVVPTSEIQNSIRWQDKNAHDVGMVKSVHETGNWHRMEMTAIAQDSSGNDIYGQLAVSIKPDGSIRTKCPQPPANSNDLSIATTSWSNSRYVNLTDAQVITGLKHFTQPPYFRILSEDLNAPSKTFSTPFMGCLDKAGLFISGLNGGMYKKNGSNIPEDMSILQLVCGAGSVNNTDGLMAEFQKDHTSVGSKRAYSPSNLTHTYLTEIATVDWVARDNLANAGKYVWFQIGNDLLITIGYEISTGDWTTVTFPHPYKYTPIGQGTVIGMEVPGGDRYQVGLFISPTSFRSNAYLNNNAAAPILVHYVFVGVPA